MIQIIKGVYFDRYDEFRGIIQDSTGISYKNYLDKLMIDTGASTVEKAFEKLLEKLTNNTKYIYKHKPSTIGNCWAKNCSELCIGYSQCIKFNQNEYYTKIEYVAMHSLLVGLVSIIDSILNYRFRLSSKNKLDITDEWIYKYISIIY